jgi:hypothetical protein
MWPTATAKVGIFTGLAPVKNRAAARAVGRRVRTENTWPVVTSLCARRRPASAALSQGRQAALKPLLSNYQRVVPRGQGTRESQVGVWHP